MNANQHSVKFGQGVIYTLAQNGTSRSIKPALIIQGNGTPLSNNNTVKKKAKRKLITQVMSLSLIDSSSKFGSPELKKGYWNTYHCQSKIITANGRIFTKFCKNRFCTVCNANRKADVLNRYMPEINTWSDPYFVTLTIKSVPFYSLQLAMKSMIGEFQKIIEMQRKRSQRKKGLKIIGIRSLECNYNPETKKYNPHFHCVVASKEMADILVHEWCKRAKPGKVNRAGQHSAKVKNTKAVLIEVVKYGSKIFTEPDIDKKSKSIKESKNNKIIYAAALNNIFHAMRALRIFERFGFNLHSTINSPKGNATVVSEYYEWQFHLPSADWLSLDTGNQLSNYIAPYSLINILENWIDIKSE